jgi:hypothetical protein
MSLIKTSLQVFSLGLDKNTRGGKYEGFSHYVTENKRGQKRKIGLAIML